MRLHLQVPRYLVVCDPPAFHDNLPGVTRLESQLYAAAAYIQSTAGTLRYSCTKFSIDSTAVCTAVYHTASCADKITQKSKITPKKCRLGK